MILWLICNEGSYGGCSCVLLWGLFLCSVGDVLVFCSHEVSNVSGLVERTGFGLPRCPSYPLGTWTNWELQNNTFTEQHLSIEECGLNQWAWGLFKLCPGWDTHASRHLHGWQRRTGGASHWKTHFSGERRGLLNLSILGSFSCNQESKKTPPRQTKWAGAGRSSLWPAWYSPGVQIPVQAEGGFRGYSA